MAETLPSGSTLAAQLMDWARSVPANVTLMQLLLAAPHEAAARDALCTAERTADGALQRRLHAVRQCWQENARAFRLVRGIARVASDSRGKSCDWASTFDAAARMSPEAAVALYSLGNRSLLAAITEELVALLRRWELLSPIFCVLDLGCGCGRVSEAIASGVHSIVAVEVSGRMAELARAALRWRKNALVVRSAGNDLVFLQDATFDVVLAIDSFPYLVDRGLADRHMADGARVLKSRGRLLIMNYSYRGDPSLDRSDIACAAQAHDFAIERNGTADLSLWDGRSFLLRKT